MDIFVTNANIKQMQNKSENYQVIMFRMAGQLLVTG